MALSDFQERKESERILFSYPLALAVSALVLAMIVGVFKMLNNYLALRKEISVTKEEIVSLQNDKAEYELKINQLKTEAGLEKEARSRFNLKKPGEEVAVFEEDENSANAGGMSGKLASLFNIFKQFFAFFHF